MKKIWLLTVVGMLALCNATRAEEAPKFVSATFQDILNRVAERDKTSGAILRVNAKEDSPRRRATLHFSIIQERKQDEVVVLLNWNSKVNDGIYERYRLRIDDAMREELKKQAHYQEVIAERSKKWQDEQAKEIERLSKGELKYRMSQAEVEAVKGKPLNIERVPTADFTANLACWFYPKMKLYFDGGMLQSVEIIE